MSGWVRDAGWDRRVREGNLFGSWDRVVGTVVAAHSHPVSLTSARLLVAAESTAWAAQLRLLQHDMMSAIEHALGPGLVSSIEVRGPTGPSWVKGPRRVPGRGPRDTYG